MDRERLAPDRFRELLAARLQPEQVQFTSFHLVPSPLDELFPRTAEWLGRQLKGSRSGRTRRLAGQVVYAARKAGLAHDSATVD